MLNIIDIDDFVIAIGFTESGKETKDYNFKICQVVAVGLNELFVNIVPL